MINRRLMILLALAALQKKQAALMKEPEKPKYDAVAAKRLRDERLERKRAAFFKRHGWVT